MKILLISILTIFITFNVNSLSVKDYQKSFKNSSDTTYLTMYDSYRKGVVNGMFVLNEMSDVMGGNQYFCLPRDTSFTRDEFNELLDKGISTLRPGMPSLDSIEISLPFLVGLKKIYPCRVESQGVARKLLFEEELRISYINQIAAIVKDHWRYKGAKDGWGCDVHILQDRQGNVKSVNVQSCVVDNKAKRKSFRDSIERAGNKASPLPSAPDEGVFESEVLFYFRVN